MKEIFVISPIKKPSDIDTFTQNSSCREFYVYHHKFLNNNFDYVKEFIDKAHATNSKIYVNFKHNITEDEIVEIKKFITYLKSTKIDGIFINSFAILEAVKTHNLPYEVIIDSYFDIHNLAGIDFINNFHKANRLIITEEIYLKNIAKIKQYTNLSLSIDSDNLPWCAEDIKKLKAIDSIVIKGKFATSEEILDGINLVEKILEKPKVFKNQKLPFKHIRKSFYQTNHFSGEVISAQGKDFKFSRYIKTFEWDAKRTRLKGHVEYKSLNLPKINLRLSSLLQMKEVKKFIDRLGFNPIYSIEFGEILNTSDLAKSSFSEVMTKVKKFCKAQDIKLQVSTPRILIERDFDRVYEYVKNICLEEPHPSTIIANNIGYLWAFINDSELHRFPIEIGQGINLLNSMSINCLNNLHPINTIDFTTFKDFQNIKSCIKKIKHIIPNKKLTISGNIRVPSLGLCPLNNDSAIVSRLSCKAPCHKGNYALKDPSLKKLYPFVVDGFCRMHMFKDEILQIYDYIRPLEQIGINEFVIDCSSLNAKFVSILLTNMLNSLTNPKNNNLKLPTECSSDTFPQNI
ncbi:MAG: U32 family peptidase [Candidatus Gastranaerophilales bacterium]|nr:U32 family peptidase [Candidatus Gastranaerophilales bacterium]